MRIILAFLYVFSSLSVYGEIIDKIVATVDSNPLTQSDVESMQRKLRSSGLVDEALLAMYDKKKLLADRKVLTDFMIDEAIIDSEIERQGLITPIEQVEAEIRNIASQRGISRDQLRTLLRNEGVDFSEYQDFVKTSIQRQNLLQKEVLSKIKVSDDEINSFYIANYSQAKALVFEYTLAHILFLNSNGGSTEAASKANAVYAKLAQKVPFETLAAQYSEDPQFVQGGLFGTFKVNDFNKDVEKVIAQLDTGDASPVVKMGDGYRIFKVIRKTLVPSPELEKRREEIRRRISSENFKRQFKIWLAQKRRDAYIKVN